ncbi:protein spaetzle isoform X2 [Drosophila sechellia]|uniref:protein spaetzle isoform X2 n=1 Tax=Drosophila sechellia TaxID=7238 RepID=UPI0013DE792B|nr:protein spaetzle isoform X2 [Drosophila sechellia]
MTPMWISLFKVLLLLSAFVGMIVYIKIVITKRDEAEVRAAKTEALLAIMNNGEPRESASYHLQYEPKEYDGIIKEIFTVNNDKGVVLFNTTADSAPFMPIPTQHDDLPQKQNQKQNQSPIPETNRHYHQYHSLIQPDQYFKVQRSPNGKLNLVFNDTFVSLQRTDTEVQSEQPTPPRHPSDTKYRPPQSPPRSLRNDTKERNPCAKDESQHLRNFCTNVDDYPDLSGLTQKLKNNFAKFFSNDLQPTDVSSRVGGSDERFLCRSIRKLVYPKKGMRADDTWQFIVNNDEYKQAIQIEECEGADQPCDFAANFPQSYNPICKQHYTQQTLASITSDGEVDVVQHSFKIPSCCKCALKTG